MTQKDKELLLKDLCARVPYRVRLEGYVLPCIILTPYQLLFMYAHQEFAIRRPYLRPMSSMTEEEKKELYHYYCKEIVDNLNTQNLTWEIRCCISNSFGTDWLLEHHFDFRNLIEKGLALKAPKGMYNIKEK